MTEQTDVDVLILMIATGGYGGHRGHYYTNIIQITHAVMIPL